MKRIVFFAIIAVALTACKTTQIVEKPVYIHDTTQVTTTKMDSVYIDRYHTIVRDGDTVRICDSIYVYRIISNTDTMYQYVEKPVTIKETEYVTKPLNWWQKFQRNGFWVLLIAVLGVVAWKLRKYWL